MPKICDWAKYHNRLQFKKYMSDQAVIKYAKMIPSWENNFCKTTVWSLIHFLNSTYYDIQLSRKFWASPTISYSKEIGLVIEQRQVFCSDFFTYSATLSRNMTENSSSQSSDNPKLRLAKTKSNLKLVILKDSALNNHIPYFLN